MLRYEFTEPLFTGKPFSGKSCQDHISSNNVDWYLFQLKRDISISAGLADTIQNNYFADSHLPDSLRGLPTNGPTWLECSIYITALDAFYRYVSQLDRHRLTSPLCAVVNTKMKVKGNNIMVFSDDLDLVDCIKEAVIGKNCVFRRATEQEAKAWWVPITSGQ